MGIRGLMTYINKNPNFFEYYELHGGYLVIDGHSLAAQLYISSRCNCAFGGDHDVYAHTIADFFDELLKCQVEPLVILDGGMEKKKMKTTYDRMVDKLRTATSYSPAMQSQVKFMPMAMMIVFKTVIRQKGVKIVRSVFEADAGIAGVSKALDCPVLSFDSDFYIFGVKYIPINTLEPYVVRNSHGPGFSKRCKLFKVENLTRSFPGLDESVLPLAAILLGNDYIKSSVFKNFFACLRLSNQTQRLYNESQRRIHTTLRWLKNYDLNDAVAAVLSKLPRKRRRKLIEKIELVVNGYLILPCDILVLLGFEDKYAEEMRNKRNKRPFKFQGNVDNLESRQLWREDQSMGNNHSEPDEKSDEESDDAQDADDEIEENLKNSWPSWFAHEHGKACFPAYFVDMMSLRYFAAPTQIEDFKYPSAYLMSLKIVEVIDGLLVAGRDGVVRGLTYLIRDGTELKRNNLDNPLRGTRTVKFPTLHELRDTPISTRKRIVDDTLEIDDKENLFEDIPPQWRLYMATIVYWMRRSEEPARNFCHMDAILFTMLLGVIDRKIGYHRTFHSFNRAHGSAVNDIESRRRNLKQEKLEAMKISSSALGKQAAQEKLPTSSGISMIAAGSSSELEKSEWNFFSDFKKPEVEESISMIKALEAVDTNDCLNAASFFISNSIMDKQLTECPRKFNVTIVHAFSQLQSCLRHAIHLNALLGCPYEYPIIANMYNGTMLYNLYTNFKKRKDYTAYIAVVLENSPSLLHLVKLLMWKARCILDNVVVAETTRPKGTKRRKNKKIKKDEPVEDDNMTLETEADEEVQMTQFVDPQNPFTALNIAG